MVWLFKKREDSGAKTKLAQMEMRVERELDEMPEAIAYRQAVIDGHNAVEQARREVEEAEERLARES